MKMVEWALVVGERKPVADTVWRRLSCRVDY